IARAFDANALRVVVYLDSVIEWRRHADNELSPIRSIMGHISQPAALDQRAGRVVEIRQENRPGVDLVIAFALAEVDYFDRIFKQYLIISLFVLGLRNDGRVGEEGCEDRVDAFEHTTLARGPVDGKSIERLCRTSRLSLGLHTQR